MTNLLILLTLALLGTIAAGLYLAWRPSAQLAARRGWQGVVVANLVLFVGAQLTLLLLGLQEALAETAAAEAVRGEVSVGLGLALIGVALPTVISTLAAAWAVGPIGSAALALIAEKPEAFGRSLVYLGLAEGIAIYGLVLSILMLDKV